MALSCSHKTVSIITGITFKHPGDSYCLNCLHSFATDKKLEWHKKYMKVKIFKM